MCYSKNMFEFNKEAKRSRSSIWIEQRANKVQILVEITVKCAEPLGFLVEFKQKEKNETKNLCDRLCNC